MDTIGTGDAIVFRNGYKIEGEWRKDLREGRTKFYTDQDEEIAFQPGKIWIAVMNRVDGISINN